MVSWVFVVSVSLCLYCKDTHLRIHLQGKTDIYLLICVIK